MCVSVCLSDVLTFESFDLESSVFAKDKFYYSQVVILRVFLQSGRNGRNVNPFVFELGTWSLISLLNSVINKVPHAHARFNDCGCRAIMCNKM